MSIYVYALARAGDTAPVQAAGVASGSPVEIVTFGDLAAIVSRTDLTEILPIRRNAIQHTRVLEDAMVTRPILPMRFGILIETLDKLEAVIAPRAPDLLFLLDELEGCIEVDIKTTWNGDLFWKDLVAKQPDLGRMGQALKSGDQNKTYYDRIELGRKVEAAIGERRKAERQRLVDAVQPMSLKIRELPLAEELSITNHALLIKGENEKSIFDTVTEFERAAAGLIDVRFLAPVPAYNFVSISLDWNTREREVA